jgi:CubicO group peptidase (beta-lactamase class C family)
LELADGPDGQWSTPSGFPLGNGGLAGTADDWLAFSRMLLAGGTAADGRRLLTADSVRLMTADQTTTSHQREIGALLLKAQGLGSKQLRRPACPSGQKRVLGDNLVMCIR